MEIRARYNTQTRLRLACDLPMSSFPICLNTEQQQQRCPLSFFLNSQLLSNNESILFMLFMFQYFFITQRADDCSAQYCTCPAVRCWPINSHWVNENFRNVILSRRVCHYLFTHNGLCGVKFSPCMHAHRTLTVVVSWYITTRWIFGCWLMHSTHIHTWERCTHNGIPLN